MSVNNKNILLTLLQVGWEAKRTEPSAGAALPPLALARWTAYTARRTEAGTAPFHVFPLGPGGRRKQLFTEVQKASGKPQYIEA